MCIEYIQFNEEIKFFNDQGDNDITIEPFKDYPAVKEQDKYRVKLAGGNEFYMPINHNSICK